VGEAVTSHGLSLCGEGLRCKKGKGEFELFVESVEVGAGETLAVLGPSGSGKTTLLELLGLLEDPDSGVVYVDGKPARKRDRGIRLQMAAVFQRPYLFKGPVYRNVEYGLVARGVKRSERMPRVAAALERVGLAGYEGRSAMALSGGEAQRVSLARALVLEPRVLLLDEPLASLDRLLRRKLTHDFATILSDDQVTVVYVTHDQDEALAVADKIAIMKAGRIVTSGSPEIVAGLAIDKWTADFLGIEPAVKGRVSACSEGLISIAVDDTTVVATGDASEGADVLVAVRPEDVLLFEPTLEFSHASVRNRLRARVVKVDPHGASVYVLLDAGGMRFASSVSRAAVTELDLATGADVLAVFKATAVRWHLFGEEG